MKGSVFAEIAHARKLIRINPVREAAAEKQNPPSLPW
jgi:hypothetical protein